jgi:taurine--2-oxoglutarate transaminase
MGVSMDATGETSEKRTDIDWKQIEKWDRQYYLHNIQAQEEHVWDGISHQEGNYLFLTDGTKLLDGASQLISDNMGHRHPHVVDGLVKALANYGHVHFGLGHEYRGHAARLIVEDLLGPDGWAGRLRILPSGTEAVQTAISMARLFTGREIVLTQEHSFHGLTPDSGTTIRGYRGQVTSSTAGDVTDIPGYPPHGFAIIPSPERQDFENTGKRLPSLEATEHIIEGIGPDKIAAVVADVMFGAAGLMGHDDYLPGLRELTQRHGILWVDDEVVCGFGRLGRWFGYQLYDGLTPDLMAIGKGMNGSIIPVGGVVASHEISDFFEQKRWLSGSTWDGHPLVCATVIANIEAMLAEDVVDNAERMGRYLRGRLEDLQKSYACVGHIGGRGLYQTIELIDESGAPIVPQDRWYDYSGDLSFLPVRVIAARARTHGVYLGGLVPNTVKISPPLTVDEGEIDLILEAVEAGLREIQTSSFGRSPES